MGEIYKKTALCVVWLEEHSDSAESAMKLLTELVNNVEVRNAFEEMMDPRTADKTSKFQQVFNTIINNISQKEIADLTVLLTHNWFSRVWVLQEVVLAPKAVAQCGSHALDFSAFIRVGYYGNSKDICYSEHNSST